MNYKTTSLSPFGILIQTRSKSLPPADLALSELKDLFHQHQLVVLRGFAGFDSAEDFSNYCARWGDICLWPFGSVLELQQQPDAKDHIFDHTEVPFHWDGMYRPEVPEYQIFHCVKAPAKHQGGRTTFCHTAKLLSDLDKDEHGLWRNIQGCYQRKMEFYHSTTKADLISKHPYKDYEVLRYSATTNNPDFINPPAHTFAGLPAEDLAKTHSRLAELMSHPNYRYCHQWEDGDIVIADNFTLLHGREAFTSMAPRHLQRVHVNSSPAYKNPGLKEHI